MKRSIVVLAVIMLFSLALYGYSAIPPSPGGGSSTGLTNPLASDLNAGGYKITGAGEVDVSALVVGATNPFTVTNDGSGVAVFDHDISLGGHALTNALLSIQFGPYSTSYYITPSAETLTASHTMDFVDANMRVPAASWLDTSGKPTFLSAESIMTISLNGGGSAIATGSAGNKRFKQAWTITGYSILSDSSCSCSVDLWETTYSAYDGTTHPVVGDSIVASAPIALSSAYKYEDVTLTGWTKTIAVDNILHANVTSCGCTGGVTIQISGSRGGF